MAILTKEDYIALRNTIYRQGFGKEELKALPTVPNKTDLMNMFQACEDWFTNGFNNVPTTSLKSALETGLGQSITLDLAKKVIQVWFKWKIL